MLLCVQVLSQQLDTTTAERDQLELRETKAYSEILQIQEMNREAPGIQEEIYR